MLKRREPLTTLIFLVTSATIGPIACGDMEEADAPSKEHARHLLPTPPAYPAVLDDDASGSANADEQVSPHLPPDAFTLLEEAESLSNLAILATPRDACLSSGGQFHDALMACSCGRGALYRAGSGCVAVPTLSTALPCGASFKRLSAAAFAHCAHTVGAPGLVVDLRPESIDDATLPRLQSELDNAWEGLFTGLLLPAMGSRQPLYTSHALAHFLPLTFAVATSDGYAPGALYAMPFDPTHRSFNAPSRLRHCLQHVVKRRRPADRPALADLCRRLAAAIEALREAGTFRPQAADSLQPDAPMQRVQYLTAQTADGEATGLVRLTQNDAGARLTYRLHLRHDVPVSRVITVANTSRFDLTAFVSPLGHATAATLRKFTNQKTGHAQLTHYDASFQLVHTDSSPPDAFF